MQSSKGDGALLGGTYLIMKTIKNVGASVRQRLANLSKAEEKPFHEILQYYAMERFLHRLALSPHCKTFILKGGLMLWVWGGLSARHTMDIDMLGQTSNDVGSVVQIMKEVCLVDVEEDGLSFDSEAAIGSLITKDGDYQGVRISFPCTLSGAKIKIQLDIGFGDVIYPAPQICEIPGLIAEQSPTCLCCYPRQTVISEKFEAMVHLGELNSRMKDFYDIWLLSKNSDFKSDELLEAIKRTFNKRGTDFGEQLPFLEPTFAKSRASNWKTFRRKMKSDSIPESFTQILTDLKPFLEPLSKALRTGNALGNWRAGQGWTKGIL